MLYIIIKNHRSKLNRSAKMVIETSTYRTSLKDLVVNLKYVAPSKIYFGIGLEPQNKCI